MLSSKEIQSKSEYKPWFTKDLQNVCNKKNKLYKQFLKYKSNSSLVKYKKYKNKLTSILRCEQKRYYNNLLIKCKNDIKGTWKILNRVIKGKTTVNSFPDTFQDQNKTVKGNKCIANGFSNFFSNVGPDLETKITSPKNSVGIYDTMGPSKLYSMYLNEVTETELVKVLSTCNHKHSCDVNDLNMYVVKSTFMSIIQPFKYICNLSFNTSVFPSEMKVAKLCHYLSKVMIVPLPITDQFHCYHNSPKF